MKKTTTKNKGKKFNNNITEQGNFTLLKFYDKKFFLAANTLRVDRL
jgi:hypothetical protein